MLRHLCGQLFTRCSLVAPRQLTCTRSLSSQVRISTPSSSSIPFIKNLWIQPAKEDPLTQVGTPIIDNGIAGLRIPQYVPSLIIIPCTKDFPLTHTGLPPIEKHAARMIVIRRRKMKKHKLRKLRKVRKFEYRRLALKRKTQKEKEFQMMLSAMVQEAEKFDARAHVDNLIRVATEDLNKKEPVVSRRKTRNPALVDNEGNEIRANESFYANWKWN